MSPRESPFFYYWTPTNISLAGSRSTSWLFRAAIFVIATTTRRRRMLVLVSVFASSCLVVFRFILFTTPHCYVCETGHSDGHGERRNGRRCLSRANGRGGGGVVVISVLADNQRMILSRRRRLCKSGHSHRLVRRRNLQMLFEEVWRQC